MAPQTAVQKAAAVTFQIEMPQIDFLKLAKIDIKKHLHFFVNTHDTGLHSAMFSAESNTSRGSLRIHKGMSHGKGKSKAFLLYITSSLSC